MEWSKIKNIIIIILLLVNVFLLVPTVGQTFQAARYSQEARTGAVAVLKQAGIEIDLAALPKDSKLMALTAERDREGEGKLARALLGTAEKLDDGGRVTYRGTTGEGSFRSNGSFSFTLTAGSHPTAGADEAQHGAKLLTAAGYACQVTRTVLEGEDTRVTVRQTWEGAPIFNCQAVLTYRNGELTAIEGQRLIGTPNKAAGSGKTLDVSTILIRFLSETRDAGYVCTKIEQLISGYQTTAQGGVSKLSPMWQVVTDVDTFWMDGATGALTLAGG